MNINGTQLLIVLVVVVGIFAVYSGWIQIGEPDNLSVTPTSDLEDQAEAANCNANEQTTVTLDVVNALNTSGSEGVDVTARFYGSDGDYQKITDTTSPNATTLNCGVVYTVKIESTDGASGDNSRFVTVSNPKVQIVDGDLVFVTSNPSMSIEAGIEQQATLEAKMFDNTNFQFMYDSGDAERILYETDGVTFTSITDNATATAVGQGGSLDVTLYLQAVQTDTNWKDRGTYFLIDAASSVWDVDNAVLTVNGQALSPVSLTGPESRGWESYELVYFYDGDITRNTEAQVRLKMNALSTVDPGASNDVQIDVGAMGQYLKTGSTRDLAIGGVKDDASNTVVRSLFDSTIDIS